MFVRKRKIAPRTREEQRNFRRVTLEADVTVEGEHNFYHGISENISEGGLFISTYELFPLGAELDLCFTLPTHPVPLRIRGRVQWVREYSILNRELPPGLGLQFIDPGPELLSAVREFVACREPTLYE